MLERRNERSVMERMWESAGAKVRLPETLRQGFFAPQGPLPTHFENKRQYHRYYMRGKAVLKRGDEVLGTYTKDVSRQGVGFYSPVQLLPKERVQLRLPSVELSLEVTRCRRVDKECFECGARFVLQSS